MSETHKSAFREDRHNRVLLDCYLNRLYALEEERKNDLKIKKKIFEY